MDSTKTAIKSLVLDLRKTLEADLETGLRRYGIAAGKLRDIAELKHLDDRGVAMRIRMEEAIKHELRRAGTGGSEKGLAEAVHWFVREVAFTHLNRLAALKVMEVRGLIPEVIQTRPEYGERSRAQRDYREAHPEAAAAADGGLEAAIKEVCRQVYPEFRILFDVGDPAELREASANSLLWPSTPALKSCIEKINALDARAGRSGPPAHAPAAPEHSVWAEDEIIGWIYQFYNAEEKVAIRQRGKPSRPAEVAVINQFFTPRWIVKFLVDNTLGRLWLEMHPDSPRVRAKCDYLVPEPAAASEQLSTAHPSGPTPGFALAADSPINNPQAEARRLAKQPQELRLIDPACGTMHFGHYAFEVFQEIYRDARQQGWVSGAEALEEADIPAAILRHNLYGVDIDLRAVQLAALSLFIKAKSAHPEARIERVNLVVADAYLPEGAVREDFLAQYNGEPLIQKAFKEVFASLENVAEVGSLLRVEERFRQALQEGGHPAAGALKAGGPRQGKMETLDGRLTAVHQPSFAELAPGWQPEYTIEQMLGHLREFARRALQEHDLNAQLFAAETEKSVALLDVFLHDYDAVVMNPPFGEPLDSAKSAIAKAYESFSNNILCAFIERATSDFAPKGMVGAVLDRTFLLKLSYEKFRRKVLLANRILTFTDLGWGVLDDANVEVSTLVLATGEQSREAVFLRASKNLEQNKVINWSKTENFVVNVNEFSLYPNASFAYWIPSSLKTALLGKSISDTQFGWAKEGIHPTNANRFIRYFWEVDKSEIGVGRKWVSVTNGGGYSPFYRDIDLILFYENEAEAIKSARGMRSEGIQFKEGITWGKRTDYVNFQYLPEGKAFTHEGLALFLTKSTSIWPFLCVLNSRLIRYATNTLCGQHKLSAYIGQLPYRELLPAIFKQFDTISRTIYALKESWDRGNESSTRFIAPWLLQAFRDNLCLIGLPDLPTLSNRTISGLIDNVLAIEQVADTYLQNLQNEIDQMVYDLYEISLEDRALIERELGERPPEVVWPYAEKLSREQKAAEHVARLMSYFLLQAIREDPDGILPVTPLSGHATALVLVRQGLEQAFGEAAAYQVELDAARYLGRPLAEWLEREFWKDYHIKWYKRRPIIWQVGSPKGTFAAFLLIHKLSRDTLPRLRTQYLWPARQALQSELENAGVREKEGERGAGKEVARLEAALEDLQDFEARLLSVIEGRVKCEIPAWAQGPFRNGMYDPLLDDGVAVNILPLQEAGVLVKKVV